MTTFIKGGPERFPHQKRAFKRIIDTHGVCALLLAPGAGKTAVTIDYMGLLAMKLPSREARVLVVCPLVAVDTWVLQMEQWVSPQVNYWAEVLGGSIAQKAQALGARGGQPPADAFAPRWVKRNHPDSWGHQRSSAFASRGDDGLPVQPQQGPRALGDEKPRIVLEVVNFDMLASRQPVGSQTMADVVLTAIRRFKPDLVVVDELHKIKGVNSNASRLLARLVPFVPRRLGLTGTVMPRSPMDVYAQWRWINPYAFGRQKPDGTWVKATHGGFQARYAVMGGYMGKQVVGFQHLDEMQEIMARNAVVTHKHEVMNLPTRDLIVPVHLSPKELKAYESMAKEMAVEFESGDVVSTTSSLTKALRLRQITGGHLPDSSGEVQVIGDSKVRLIDSLVNDTLEGEKRVVVFALFTAEIEQLRDRLSRTRGTEVMVITGGTSSEERMRMRARFGSDDPQRMVMIAQISTMSISVNELVTAQHCVFASLSQKRDDLIQGRDRLNRLGQKGSQVTFWYALAPGTLDEVIYKSHRDGTALEHSVLTHVQQYATGKR